LEPLFDLATSKGQRSLKDFHSYSTAYFLLLIWEVKDQLRMGVAYKTYFTTIAYNFTTIAYNYFTTIPISRGVGRGLHVTQGQRSLKDFHCSGTLKII
jgi:hypothetical protein